MKKAVIVAFFLLLVFHHQVYANGAGLPPFFKINGKDSVTNPLQVFGITAQSFLIPQDFTPENYIVNQPINFEIDKDQFRGIIQEEFMESTKFTWDYGDGTKAEGIKNSHTYSKIGSYILVLTINVYTDPNQQPIQFVDSFLLNVVPNKNFNKLPQAVIKVNGNKVQDTFNKLVNVNFNNPVNFDSSSSKSSSKIVAYIWNFGDGQTSTEKIVNHKYENQPFQTVVLRIKDSNGFISDAFVGLNNNPKLQQEATNERISSNKAIYLLIFTLILMVILIVYAAFIQRKKK